MPWLFRKRRANGSSTSTSGEFFSNSALESQSASAANAMTDERYEEILAEIEASQLGRAAWREASMVRGRVNYEWSAEVARLKREGHLEDALALVYECLDASERAVAAYPDLNTVAHWANDAAVILRKMGDVEMEIRLLERITSEFPHLAKLSERLAKARVLEARSHRP